ncbi:MAG: class I SAM-dependent methyltransferase [Chloroflexota bacterium]
MRPVTQSQDNRWLTTKTQSGAEYARRFDDLAAQGKDVHGEASLIQSLEPRTVLDAGCGTGRVGIELARRGIDVMGVDIDPEMLAVARERGPHIAWHLGDLATFDGGTHFDCVVLAGNVMIFLAPGSEGLVLGNLARQLRPGGLLVAGFQLGKSVDLADYDRLAATVGLDLAHRWSTWDRASWEPQHDYAVSVHRRCGS